MPEPRPREYMRLPERSGGRIVPLEAITDNRLRLALALWEDKRGVRRYPARTDLTLRGMVPFLRNITLWRRAKDGTDYEYRIMGDGDAESYGRSMVGLYVSDLDALRPGNGALVMAVLDSIVRKGRPKVSAGWLIASNGRHVYHEMLFLPLGPDDATIDHIMGVSVNARA